MSRAKPLVLFWRPAHASDARATWAWRNDAETRRRSLISARIPFATHEAWLTRKLADKCCALWIALDGSGRAVGQARLDLDRSGTATVSISVAPPRRGQGWGTVMLETLPVKVGRARAKRMLAVIKPDNVASLIAFLKAGYQFKRSAKSGGQTIYELDKKVPARG